jgi:hypothetical protein
MHHLGFLVGSEMESDATDQAGRGVALGRVADEACGFGDDEEGWVLMQDMDPLGGGG